MILRNTILIISSLLYLQNGFAQTTPKTTPKTTVKTQSGTTTIKSGNNKITVQPGTSNPAAKKFSFTGSYTMKFTSKDKKGKTSTGEIKSAFDEYQMATIPTFSDDKEMNLRSIFDLKENTMTMLFVDVKKNKKNGMMMKMPNVTVSGNTATTTVTSTIQKTAETKIIDGYKCTKWIISYSDGAKCESWVTKDITLNSAESVSYFTTGMKGKKSPINTECANINGCAIESYYTSSDGTTVFMKTTDIKKGKPDASFFTTSGYEITDVTGIQFFK